MSAVIKEPSVLHKKWRIIGEVLGVRKNTLDSISAQHSDVANCLLEVLSHRVSNQATTWGDITAVLRSSCVGEFQLADQLEAKYCPSELADLHCSTSNVVEGCLPIHWCV